MALSNAERQQRWRERLKAKAATVENAVHPDDLATMRESWERSIEELRQQRNDAHKEANELRRRLAEAIKPAGSVTNGGQRGGQAATPSLGLDGARAAYLKAVAHTCTSRPLIALEHRRVKSSLESMTNKLPAHVMTEGEKDLARSLFGGARKRKAR